MHIRDERPEDADAVRAVLRAAFPTPGEARLVDLVRGAPEVACALVAVDDDRVVGHVLFTRVQVTGADAVGLGPVAVVPDAQRRGIGAALVRAGLDRCRDAGFQAAVVLGDPAYYGRFGFRSAADVGIHCEYDVAPGVFQVLALADGALDASGLVRYCEAFRVVG